MTTLVQLATSEEVWSLEESDGALFLHHVVDRRRTVIPVMPEVLERMTARLLRGSAPC